MKCAIKCSTKAPIILPDCAIQAIAAYHASSDYLLALQVFGTGTAEAVHTSTYSLPDADGVYQDFLTDETPWTQGRVALDPDKLFAEFTCTASTPDPLASLRCDFNDGSTASYSFKDNKYLVRNVASGISQQEAGLVDSDKIGVYIGNNTALQYFACYSNQLTGSIPSLDNNTALQYFYCHSNQLTGYPAGTNLNFTNTIDFNASNNLLTEEAVNNILIAFDNGTIGAGSTINVGGTGNAAPTGAGITAKDNLIAAGHTVVTN